MKSLIVDSATQVLYIALVIDGRVNEKYIPGRNDHAKYIVSTIDELLKSENITTNELDEIICGIGPGSYTGVRMAVTVCKMMTVFMNKPLYKISTLKLIASNLKGIVLSTIDARRGNVFGTIIDTINDKYIIEEAHTSYSELKENHFDFEVNENDFKVDALYILEHKEKVIEPHLLVPNYLRDTEAERNLHD